MIRRERSRFNHIPVTKNIDENIAVHGYWLTDC
jgi:hypothetical protein